MPEIDIHADDYALTVHTSQDILNCMKAGKLDSISVLTNMDCSNECIELLLRAVPELPFLPKMSVHLNFVEGRCLTGAKGAPLLTRKNSNLAGLSWESLFMLSYHPFKRKPVKEQLKKEMKAQLAAGWREITRCMESAKTNAVPCKQKGIRIDSHQHAHMIPVVWEALTEVIQEEGYQVEYIRNSKEVLGAFLLEVPLWKTYRPINFVKNILLSAYSHKVDRYTKKHSMKQMYMWGLIMSGHMDYDRIVRLYPKIAAQCDKNHRTLEFCFHPGTALADEVTEEIGNKAACDFYLLPDRQIEMDAVMRLTFLKSTLSG